MRQPARIVDLDLHAFADNVLPAERRTAILSALEADAAEARRVSDWCAQNEAIRRMLSKVLHEPVPVTLSLATAPPSLPFKPTESSGSLAARTRISDPAPQARTLRQPDTNHAWRLRRWGLLVGVCALVLASGWTGASFFGSGPKGLRSADIIAPSDATSAFALRAVETYRAFALDAQYPVEIPAAQSLRLVQWLERRLGERVVIPNLTTAGFTLLGGRLVPWVTRRPAALLIYQGAVGQRLAVMVTKAALGAELPFRQEQYHGISAMTWMQSGNIVSVVGVTDPQSLRSVATVAASELNQATGP